VYFGDFGICLSCPGGSAEAENLVIGYCLEFGAWLLIIVWNLVLGYWLFSFSLVIGSVVCLFYFLTRF
jgi:hypothetical protein